jgi:hypothetical protein
MKWSAAVLLAAAGCATLDSVPDPIRLSPREVAARMERGEPVLLVCAYDSRKCSGSHPAGSLTLEEFEKRAPVETRRHEIVFVGG